LTYAFSKKWDHLKAAQALHFAYYNFCWKHGSLKGITPAMKAGITDRVWALSDLLSEASRVGYNMQNIGRERTER
jgi:hypothetical protein